MKLSALTDFLSEKSVQLRVVFSRKPLIFVSSGGMGSSYLVRAISKNLSIPCVEKPFINSFFFDDYPDRIRSLYPGRPVLEDKKAIVTFEVCELFEIMQDKYCTSPHRFSLVQGKSIQENMVKYLGFLEQKRIAAVLRGSSCTELISENNFEGVCFLIRDPIQSYISYTKPIRHKRDIDLLGGIDADGALDFWAWSWNCVADEYLRCLDKGLNPVLLRYEYIQRDLATSRSSYLKQIFCDFSEKKNENSISSRTERKLKDLVRERYTKIYTD